MKKKKQNKGRSQEAREEGKQQRKEGERMNKSYKEEGESKLKRRLANRGEGNNNRGKGQPKIEKEQ